MEPGGTTPGLLKAPPFESPGNRRPPALPSEVSQTMPKSASNATRHHLTLHMRPMTKPPNPEGRSHRPWRVKLEAPCLGASCDPFRLESETLRSTGMGVPGVGGQARRVLGFGFHAHGRYFKHLS